MSPSEHRLILRALADRADAHPSPEVHDLLARLSADEVDPEARVLHLRLDLGSFVLGERRKNQGERARIRKLLGKTRLSKGEGPTFEVRPYAATMNEYANLDKWQKTEMREAIDALLVDAMEKWPLAKMEMANLAKPSKPGRKAPKKGPAKASKRPPRVRWSGGRRRAVVLTRYACQPTDEPGSVDVSGGKFILDAMVRAGVLRDDDVESCARFAEWKHVPSSQPGWCEIDVYELKATGAKS